MTTKQKNNLLRDLTILTREYFSEQISQDIYNAVARVVECKDTDDLSDIEVDRAALALQRLDAIIGVGNPTVATIADYFEYTVWA